MQGDHTTIDNNYTEFSISNRILSVIYVYGMHFTIAINRIKTVQCDKFKLCMNRLNPSKLEKRTPSTHSEDNDIVVKWNFLKEPSARIVGYLL